MGAQSSIERRPIPQRISVVELDALLKGLENIPMIMDP
jgi:hypothetical protein